MTVADSNESKDEPKTRNNVQWYLRVLKARRGGEVLPYMGYIGMCRCEGYGFQAVYSRIGYINQNIWV